MPDAACQPCAARLRSRVATRLVDGIGSDGKRIRIPKCDDCWKYSVPVELLEGEKARFTAAAMNVPAPAPRPAAAPILERKDIPVRKDIDWNEIQRRRNIGTPVSQLAKELGVSDVTVYTRTAPAKAKPSTPAAPASHEKQPLSHVKAHANGFRYVDLAEVPMRKRMIEGDPFYTALAAALLCCPAGKAVPFDIPARPAAAKNPQGALRGGIARALRVAKAQNLRFFVAVEKNRAWVWPRRVIRG